MKDEPSLLLKFEINKFGKRLFLHLRAGGYIHSTISIGNNSQKSGFPNYRNKLMFAEVTATIIDDLHEEHLLTEHMDFISGEQHPPGSDI